MQLLKNYVIEKTSEEIQNLANEEGDISMSFDIYNDEEGFNLKLTRDGEGLSFGYFEDEFSFNLYHECYEELTINVTCIEDFENIKEAIDLLLMLFTQKNWHESVGVFMDVDFWKFVELYKNQKLDLSLGYPCYFE